MSAPNVLRQIDPDRDLTPQERRVYYAMNGRRNFWQRMATLVLIVVIAYKLISGNFDYILPLMWVPFGIFTIMKFKRVYDATRINLRGANTFTDKVEYLFDGAGSAILGTVFVGLLLAALSAMIVFAPGSSTENHASKADLCKAGIIHDCGIKGAILKGAADAISMMPGGDKATIKQPQADKPTTGDLWK